jgi:RNA polymerase-binding protein DksA
MSKMLETPNPTFVEEFGCRLRAGHRALLRTLALNDDELATLAIHEIGDSAEDAATESARTILMRLEDQERRDLDEIEQALARLEYGTFGVCEACQGLIPMRRLRAIPTTRYCLGCQATTENEAGRRTVS